LEELALSKSISGLQSVESTAFGLKTVHSR
jgi:hypothetical protein